MTTPVPPRALFDRWIVARAIADALRKLDPRRQVRNPVMFVVSVGSLLTTGLSVQALLGTGEAPASFNALIIIALIPLALLGVRYRPIGAALLLRRHLWIYGVGGLVVPFVGIKLVDLILVVLGLG